MLEKIVVPLALEYSALKHLDKKIPKRAYEQEILRLNQIINKIKSLFWYKLGKKIKLI